jgi:hypothetical protein
MSTGKGLPDALPPLCCNRLTQSPTAQPTQPPTHASHPANIWGMVKPPSSI